MSEKTASELLAESEKPFYEACEKVKQLEKEHARLKMSLTVLVNVKKYKDENGKDEIYLTAKDAAWLIANETMELIK